MKNFTGKINDVLLAAWQWLSENQDQIKVTAAYLFEEKYGYEIIIHYTYTGDKPLT